MSLVPIEPTSILRDILLLTFETELDENSIRLLQTALSPEKNRYIPKHLHQIDTKSLFEMFLSLFLLKGSLERYTTLLSNRFLQTGNQTVGLLKQLDTSINQASDLISVSKIYDDSFYRRKRSFRVYPTVHKQNDKPISPLVKGIEDLTTTVDSLLKGTSEDLNNATENAIQKITKIKGDAGESIINLKTQSEKSFNSLKMSLGSTTSRVGKVKEVRVKGVDGAWEPISISVPSPQRTMMDFALPLRPTIGKEVQVVIEHTDPIFLSDIKFQKILYRSEGEILNKEIVVGKPIKSISIADESLVWWDERLKEYMEVVYEVSVDNKEWYRLRPIQSSVLTEVPELILINSLTTFDGAENVDSALAVERFWIKGNFYKKKEIPQYILREIATRQQLKKRKTVFLSGTPSELEVLLDEKPLEGKVEVVGLGMGRLDSRSHKGINIGRTKAQKSFYVPPIMSEALDKNLIKVEVGGILSAESTATSIDDLTSNDYRFIEKDHIQFAYDLTEGLDILISHLPHKLTLNRQNEQYHTSNLNFYSDGSIKESELYYYKDPESTSFSPSTFKHLGDNVYSFKVPKKPITSISSISAYDPDGSQISSLFTSSQAFISGRENNDVGDYSYESTSGLTFANLGTYNPQSISINVNYSYEERLEHSNDWRYINDNKSVQIANVWSVQTSITADQDRNTRLSVSSTRFSIMPDSISIRNCRRVKEDDFMNVYVQDIVLPELTDVGGSLYQGTLNHNPADTSLPINGSGSLVAYKTSTSLMTTQGDWGVIDGSNLYIYSPSGIPTGSMSYSYINGYSPTSTQFYLSGSDVVFDHPITESDLLINYRMSSYHLEYNVAQPEAFSYNQADNSIKLDKNYSLDLAANRHLSPLQTPSGLAISYDYLEEKVSDNVEQDIVSLIPEYIDVEVTLA